MKMNQQKIRKQRKLRSKKIKGILDRPRAVIFKSGRYLTAQIINDEKGQTLIYLCTANLDKETHEISYCRKNKKWARNLGLAVADKLQEQKIKQVVFDRNGYPYHGKIRVFCEAMREKGVKF
jgi:large subunit ribosomal protein L18